MKNFILFLVLITVFITSCQDDSVPEPTIKGFYAKKNDEEIKGRVEIYSIAKTDSLTILFDNNLPNNEVLVVKIPYNGVGKYAVKRNQSYYYSTVGGDVFMSEYDQLSSDAGQLEVLKYDKATKTLTGKFSIRLNKKWSYLPTDVNVIRFTEGFFQGKVNNYLAAL